MPEELHFASPPAYAAGGACALRILYRPISKGFVILDQLSERREKEAGGGVAYTTGIGPPFADFRRA
jgi:hypothetical protein